MGLLDEMKSAVGQFTTGGGSAQDLTAAFHQMLGTTDSSTLSQGISAALASNQTPPFAQMVSQLVANGFRSESGDSENSPRSSSQMVRRANCINSSASIG